MRILWLGCRCCRLSVSIICGGIMVGFVVVNKSNHNSTIYYVYWRTKPTINPTIIRPHIVSFVSKHNIWSSYDWIYCCCRSSVNTRCGRIMIGLSLSSVSKQNILLVLLWYHILCLLTNDNNNKPNRNTTFYAYWQTTTTNPNTRCGRIMIGLSLSSVSKQNILLVLLWLGCRFHIVLTDRWQQQ
jgi:hypothetical protein